MPVPKRQTSKARRDQRQSCKFIRPGQIAHCSHCSAPVVQHCVCMSCGYYKGRKILTPSSERLKMRTERRQQAHAARSGDSN